MGCPNNTGGGRVQGRRAAQLAEADISAVNGDVPTPLRLGVVMIEW
jgi:hypothetical protein